MESDAPREGRIYKHSGRFGEIGWKFERIRGSEMKLRSWGKGVSLFSHHQWVSPGMRSAQSVKILSAFSDSLKM